MSVDRGDFKTSYSFINMQDKCENNTDQNLKDNELKRDGAIGLQFILISACSQLFCCFFYRDQMPLMSPADLNIHTSL